MLVEFSAKLVYSTMCEKYFQLYGVHIPRKGIESRHFYSFPNLPTQNLRPGFYHNSLGRRKFSLPQTFLKNLLPPTAERGGRNFELFYQNPIRKYEDDLEH